MERYITFIKNNKTGEEFISMRKALSGAHDNVLLQEGIKYALPAYTIHTTYTDVELRDILETLDRWTGTSVMKDTSRLTNNLIDIPRLVSQLS
ncbi:MAG: hypothetical protein ACI9TY_000384 [Alphaproteobacteria bacterium]|jgi:hypothetical protein